MSGALAARAAQEEGSRGRVEATKVRRYWPGKRPDWVEEEEELAVLGSRAPASHSKKQDAAQHTGIAAPVIVSRADARLRRLHRSQEAGTADDEEARPRRSHQREIIEPQIVRRAREPETDHRSRRDDDEIREKKEDDEEAESDEEATALRRRMLRERIQREENEAATALRSAGPSIGGTEVPPRGYVHPEEEGEEEESSEYETEDEDEEVAQVLLKPVFVPKTDRETIRERELLEQREEARAEGEEARLQARKEETREMVAARLEAEAAEEEAAARAPRGMDDVDTDDEQDEEAAYDAWRLRELSRIARDLAEREQEAAEAAERARWQALSEEEREREIAARRAAILEVDKPKKKWRFLQKYWHRGAFFQDAGDAQAEGASIAGDITQRDFSAPTGEDLFDRASLPKIMQKRNFGLRGQTKWTHLVDQDTTSWDALWMQKERVHGKLTKKLAGTEQVFTRPRNTNT